MGFKSSSPFSRKLGKMKTERPSTALLKVTLEIEGTGGVAMVRPPTTGRCGPAGIPPATGSRGLRAGKAKPGACVPEGLSQRPSWAPCPLWHLVVGISAVSSGVKAVLT